LHFWKSFISFQFHSSIQIYGIFFFQFGSYCLDFFLILLWKFYLFAISLFNLNLCYIIFTNLVLIFFLFLLLKLFFFSISLFNKKFVFICYVNFDHHLFDFLGLYTKLIFLFNFALQSNIKFILHSNFDTHSFNCFFFVSNPFVQLKFFFQFQPSIFDWLEIRLHDFF
jgi:hypothetical protein